jgi:hypothetical protein
MVRSKENLIGAYAFLVGVVFAVVIGLTQKLFGITYSNVPYAFLVILGIIIGFLNVGGKDSLTFLIASLALVIVSGFGQSALIYVSNIPILSSLTAILASLLLLFIPATIIVALKTVFNIARV